MQPLDLVMNLEMDSRPGDALQASLGMAHPGTGPCQAALRVWTWSLADALVVWLDLRRVVARTRGERLRARGVKGRGLRPEPSPSGTDRACARADPDAALETYRKRSARRGPRVSPPRDRAAADMLLGRLASRLLRAGAAVGCPRPRPAPRGLPSPACRAPYGARPAGSCGADSLPGKGVRLALEEVLVPRTMSISPLESCLTARCLLPRLDAGSRGCPLPPYECPPSQKGSGAEQGGQAERDAPSMQCRNVLKIRRRKMNHHKYRKLVKRTRFLRRKVREGRLQQKQVKFERDLRRIWLKAGLKEAPSGWQVPKIYLKGK
ncbi:aurora kinase A-interacting protein [Talpa occidentalis]|uniref:aurora kinase A-interacting protein n=1 Tax=Talpa occidentalis TaxID=50954 RepID=UPI00188F469F|nr:aurora kinase A-interacting protein [Talpa occidentalis]